MEADHLIRTANLELESISNKAHKISIEVEESKDTVTSLYMELQNKSKTATARNRTLEGL